MYGRAAGVNVSPHKLPLTFARMYVLGGGDPSSLAQILGHEDMSTVPICARMRGQDVQRLHGWARAAPGKPPESARQSSLAGAAPAGDARSFADSHETFLL